MVECEFCGEQTLASTAIKTTAYGMTGFMCRECIEFHKLMETWDTPKEQMTAQSFSYGQYTPTTNYVPGCSHNGDELELADGHVVYLSSYSGTRGKAFPVRGGPDAAVYMASSWIEDGSMFSNCGGELRRPGEPATLYIEWPDFGRIAVEQLIRAVDWVLAMLEVCETFEVGCIGGHGRTGTLVAAVLVGQGMAADEAIAYVKREYCDKAIETQNQQWLVYEYEERLRPGTWDLTPPPEPPKVVAKTSVTDWWKCQCKTTAGGILWHSPEIVWCVTCSTGRPVVDKVEGGVVGYGEWLGD